MTHAVPAGERRLIARRRLFGNPTHTMCRISPDGETLSWLAPKDGVLNLDVRLTLETDDGATIYMIYRGYRHGPEEVIERLNRGEDVDPNEYYFRTAPMFETASEKYAWLNSVVCVATGRRNPDGPMYDVFQVL